MSTNEVRQDPSSGTAGHRRRRSNRSHEAILLATSELLTEAGYARLTIEGVAARAGVGKATVYRWWPSKAALVVEAMSGGLDNPRPAETGDVRRDLLDAVSRAIHVLARSPEGALIPALAADLIHDPTVAAQFREQILRPRRSRVAAILQTAVDRAELPANLDIDLLMDVYVGAIFYRVVVSGEPVNESLAQQLVSLLLDGKPPLISSAD
jgi:AcrR family transcriptional regulator